MNNLLNQGFFRQVLIFFVIVLTGFSFAAVLLPHLNSEEELKTNAAEINN